MATIKTRLEELEGARTKAQAHTITGFRMDIDSCDCGPFTQLGEGFRLYADDWRCRCVIGKENQNSEVGNAIY